MEIKFRYLSALSGHQGKQLLVGHREEDLVQDRFGNLGETFLGKWQQGVVHHLPELVDERESDSTWGEKEVVIIVEPD